MAQLNITLDQEEIQPLLSKNSGDACKKPLQKSRNRFRDRELNTRIGRIMLHVPRH